MLAGAAATVPALARRRRQAAVRAGQLHPQWPRLWPRCAAQHLSRSRHPDPGSQSANDIFIGHSSIKRVKTGFQWAEGPAWSGEGQYVVFSDVSGDIQYRYIWETGEITPFRRQSFNSNGNTFDFQGRQVSAQHYPAPRGALGA